VPDAAAGGSSATPGNSATAPEPWPWPETLDAVIAAPGSHRVLMDNERVRVLEVVIEPGTREPEHTHHALSVMLIGQPAHIRYCVG
jgi:quercetin dioxygenase-like cupin family protein